ncbi:MAG: NifU family protein [Patescibacteria group bacterium]
MAEKIKKSLEEIRPYLAMDGGNVEFVDFDVESGVLKVKMMGACAHCPMSQTTLKEGIGRTIKEAIKEVKEVINI